MRFGLTPEQYRLVVAMVVKPLSVHGAKVYCYGSRARGDYQKFSDLDLMVEGDAKVRPLLSEMREALQASDLPIKVDLVYEPDFAEAYRQGYLNDRKPFD